MTNFSRNEKPRIISVRVVIGNGYDIKARINDQEVMLLSVPRISTPTDWRGLFLDLNALRKSEEFLTFIDRSLPISIKVW